MGFAQDRDSNVVACEKLVVELQRLNADLKVPSPSELGLVASDDTLVMMAQQALASGSPQNNPRVPCVDKIVRLYKQIW